MTTKNLKIGDVITTHAGCVFKVTADCLSERGLSVQSLAGGIRQTWFDSNLPQAVVSVRRVGHVIWTKKEDR